MTGRESAEERTTTGADGGRRGAAHPGSGAPGEESRGSARCVGGVGDGWSSLPSPSGSGRRSASDDRRVSAGARGHAAWAGRSATGGAWARPGARAGAVPGWGSGLDVRQGAVHEDADHGGGGRGWYGRRRRSRWCGVRRGWYGRQCRSRRCMVLREDGKRRRGRRRRAAGRGGRSLLLGGADEGRLSNDLRAQGLDHRVQGQVVPLVGGIAVACLSLPLEGPMLALSAFGGHGGRSGLLAVARGRGDRRSGEDYAGVGVGRRIGYRRTGSRTVRWEFSPQVVRRKM